MTHQRKTIRDAVVTLLNDGSIVAANKVFSNRSLKYWDGELPIINVFTKSENSQPNEICTHKLDRTLTIVIEAIASDSSDAVIDNVLDDLAEKIENKLKSDDSWGGTVEFSTLNGTDIDSSQDGEKPIGSITLTYTARYIF